MQSLWQRAARRSQLRDARLIVRRLFLALYSSLTPLSFQDLGMSHKKMVEVVKAQIREQVTRKLSACSITRVGVCY